MIKTKVEQPIETDGEMDTIGNYLRVSYLAAVSRAATLSEHLTSDRELAVKAEVSDRFEELEEQVQNETATITEVFNLVDAVGSLNDYLATGDEGHLNRAREKAKA